MTKKITIEVPDSFTAEQIKAVQEFALVKVERTLREAEVPLKATVDANNALIDECRTAIGMSAKYEPKIEE